LKENMRIQQIKIISNLQIHHADDNICIGASTENILQSTDNGKTWELLGRIRTNLRNLVCLRFSLYSRLTRSGIYNILPLSKERLLVVGNHQIYCLDRKNQTVCSVHGFRRGKRLLCNSVCIVPDDGVYYGEYWSNTERDPVHIYRSDNGNKWEIFYTFPKNQVRHVHALEFDPFTKKLWITTGDKDCESMIAFFNDSFSKLEIVGSGSQQWRTLTLLFTESAVFWGTDDPDGHNKIWKIDRNSKQVTDIAEVIGPVYYGKKVGNHLLFATSVEHGTGNQDGYAHLYGINPKGNCNELAKWKRDIWHTHWWLGPNLFGHSIVEFASGQLQGNRFWITTKSIQGGLKSILYDIDGER